MSIAKPLRTDEGILEELAPPLEYLQQRVDHKRLSEAPRTRQEELARERIANELQKYIGLRRTRRCSRSGSQHLDYLYKCPSSPNIIPNPPPPSYPQSIFQEMEASYGIKSSADCTFTRRMDCERVKRPRAALLQSRPDMPSAQRAVRHPLPASIRCYGRAVP